MNEISFVAMASHEFRTPLSAILSSAALLSHYTREDQQDLRNKHIRKIKDSALQINALLESFLTQLTVSSVTPGFPPPPYRKIPPPNLTAPSPQTGQARTNCFS